MKRFFVGVKAVIVRDGKVLLLRHATKDFWDMPGGRIDDDETIEQALRRELCEELPSHREPQIGRLLNAYRVPGSIQDDLGLVLLFYRVDATFDGEMTLSDEHSDYAWVTLDEALVRGSDGIQSTVRRLLEEQ